MRKPRYANPVNQAAVFARELEGLIVSVDVSTGDHDAGARVYGQVYTAQADEEQNASVTLLAEQVEDTRRTYRAADLPAGSVVAGDTRAWFKGEADRPEMPEFVWQPGSWSNSQIDQEIAHGAQVLRVGTGRS